ncbi:MAG: hypothetical protein DMF68_16530 [Acidobacteria bacterium]|nr:MAG: hypothetical protein DMF68_16530 [Acidobacteriota bacterium]
MNLRKHVAGFIIFSTIVGSAVLINAYLSAPANRVRTVLISKTVPQAPVEASQPIKFKVLQVSLDLANNKSYTELCLERQPGQPAPERVWVTTIFFTPEHPGIVSMSKVAIRQPFAQSDQSDFVAMASGSSFAAPYGSGFFARVYVSTDYSDYSNFPDETFVRDITGAIPVVIQWRNIKYTPQTTVKKFTR